MSAIVTAVLAVGLALAAGPSAPHVTGSLRPAAGATSTYVLSSHERGVAAAKLHYRCSVDKTALHGCRRKLRVKLSAGTHVLRAQAVDPAGRRSSVTRVTVVARQPVPALAAQQVWQLDVSDGKGVEAQFVVATGPDGNAYVADAVNDRVEVYDTAGKLLRRWGSPGSGPGQFRFEQNPDPRDAGIAFSSIAIDHTTGAVYVAESQRVQRFSALGGFQLAIAAVGLGNGQFTRITSLDIGPSGTLYVLEDRPDRLGRVQEFDPSGSFVTTFGRGQIIDSGGIAVDAAGNTLVSDDLANDIKVFAPDGRLLRTFGEPGNEAGQLHYPTAMSISGNALYVADVEHNQVVRFDLQTGKPTGYWKTGVAPTGMAVDAAGAVYVITQNGTLTKYVLGS